MRTTLATLLLLVPAPLAAAQAREAADLGAELEALRAESQLPALGAALVTRDGSVDVWVAGTRRAGGEERVEAGDRWHLGSCTKSMTATLIALLVARGDLEWDALLGDLLPDLAGEMHLDYTDVTLVELLSHRAGITNAPAASTTFDFAAPLVQQRAAVARAVLTAPPVHAPRGAILYSNVGVLIAGHVAEVATGKTWEELMQELLFRPLGMTSAGFGPPGTAGTCDQPRGHSEQGKPVEPGPGADNPAMLGPAGTVHASLADWAKYVQLHLRGARGDVEVGELTLTRDAFARLHTPYPGPGQRYALGWGVERRPWAGGDGTALWHNGSNTMWYCVSWLGLENGVAALVATNVATPAARGATDRAAALVLEEAERRRADAER
jgi:CubicO group peptidase (beta-lactamase class C family)